MEKILVNLAPYPLRPPVVFFSSSSKLDPETVCARVVGRQHREEKRVRWHCGNEQHNMTVPVSKWPKISSGTYTLCSWCFATGMPFPLFHTEIMLVSVSISTYFCLVGGGGRLGECVRQKRKATKQLTTLLAP